MKEYLYQVGDKVMIRRDLSFDKAYYMRSGPRVGGFPGISKFMMNRGGEIHTVTAHAKGYYRIDDEPDAEHGYKGNWCWSDEMFELLHNECQYESLL